MPGIDDANMSIFDSPPPLQSKRATGGAPKVGANDKEGSTFSTELEDLPKKKKLTFLENDSKNVPEEMPFPKEPVAIQKLSYEDLIKEAAKWQAKMITIRDDLDALQVEAAVTLDNFAMLYDDSNESQQESSTANALNQAQFSTIPDSSTT